MRSLFFRYSDSRCLLRERHIMQAGYFSTAWNDIKSSQGWLKKMFLLALVMLIPIFGAITVNGYLYGWARDAAWKIKTPLPQRIFGNEDGKLYSRGFFILVLGFVLTLILGIFYAIYMGLTGASLYSIGSDSPNYGIFAGFGIVTLLFWVIYIAAAFAITFFQWVGAMRISIYGSLSAGFQLKKVWMMIRHDFGGLLRIFGMNLIVTMIVSVVFSIVGTILAVILIVPITLMISSNSASTGAVIGLILASLVLVLIITYALLIFEVWVMTLVTRALGYWTAQFDVPNWRGQDDPMPFELNQQASQYAQAQQTYQQQPPVQQQPVYQQPPIQQAPVQQPTYQQQPYQAPQSTEPSQAPNVQPPADTPKPE